MSWRDHPDLVLLARRVTDGDPVTLGLTEVELGLVTRPDMDGRRFVRLPGLERLSAAERTSALEQAGRALAGRGLLGRDPDATSLLAGLLTMRAYPLMTAIADRFDSGAASHRYLYGMVLPGDIDAVLEEAVDTDRIHRFSLHRIEDAGARLARFTDPHDRACQDGASMVYQPDQILPAGWDTVGPALAEAETVTQLFSTRSVPDQPPPADDSPASAVRKRLSIHLSMVTGPSGAMVVSGHVPVRDGQTVMEEGVLAAQQLAPDSLRALLTNFIRLPPISPQTTR